MSQISIGTADGALSAYGFEGGHQVGCRCAHGQDARIMTVRQYVPCTVGLSAEDGSRARAVADEHVWC